MAEQNADPEHHSSDSAHPNHPAGGIKPTHMEVIRTAIDGPVIIEPRIFRDDRGYFFESFSEREFREKVADVHFVQDNESRSCYGVIRGLHFQKPPFAQAKLVRVIKGSVLDVAVDIRRGSPTFGQHVAVELTGDNHRQFFIPRGFAHGFSVLSDEVVFQYKCDSFYAPQPGPRHRLAHPRRQGDTVGEGQEASAVQGLRDPVCACSQKLNNLRTNG